MCDDKSIEGHMYNMEFCDGVSANEISEGVYLQIRAGGWYSIAWTAGSSSKYFHPIMISVS